MILFIFWPQTLCLSSRNRTLPKLANYFIVSVFTKVCLDQGISTSVLRYRDVSSTKTKQREGLKS